MIQVQDLLDEVNTRRRLLHQALELYKQRATELASAEREYKVASAKYITEQRLNGTPATLIRELAQGEERPWRLSRRPDRTAVQHLE